MTYPISKALPIPYSTTLGKSQVQRRLDASLERIWPIVRSRIGFGMTYTPLEANSIRDWLNDPQNEKKTRCIIQLQLNDLGLSLLPPEISRFSLLKILILSHNALEQFPSEIGNLTHLKALDLSHNSLAKIPSEIGNLNQLKYLYLQFNQLTTLPVEIYKLLHLTELFLFGNQVIFLLSYNLREIDSHPNILQLFTLKEIEAKHAICSKYRCRTSLASLWQEIHRDAPLEILENKLEQLSLGTKNLIGETIESLWEELEDDLSFSDSKSEPKEIQFKDNYLFFLNLILSTERLFESLPPEKQKKVCLQSWNLSGKPSPDDRRLERFATPIPDDAVDSFYWLKLAASDNIIQLIDLLQLEAESIGDSCANLDHPFLS